MDIEKLANRLPPMKDMPDMEKAATIAAARHGVTVRKIMSGDRSRSVARARQEAFWLAHKAGWNLSEIGRYFGRDHTTVLHGVNETERRIKEGK